MSGLPPGADGRDRCPVRLRSGSTLDHFMRRRLTPIRVAPSRLASPKPTVKSCLMKVSGDDVPCSSANSRLLTHHLLAPATAPLKKIGTHPSTPFRYSPFPEDRTFLLAPPQRFNTHSTALGPAV